MKRTVLISLIATYYILSVFSKQKTNEKEIDCLQKQRYVDCVFPKSVASYTPHWETSRDLTSLMRHIPDFFDWIDVIHEFLSSDKPSILEIGAGAGRVVMELKMRFPDMYVVGTNFDMYGAKPSVNNKFGQLMGTEDEFWATAKAFNLNVKCDAITKKPLFPEILLTKKIQEYKLPYNETFDLIVSRQALMEGKVGVNESHMFLRNIYHTLKPGGIMILHLLTGGSGINVHRSFIFNKNEGHIYETAKANVLEVFNIRHGEVDASIIFYQVNCEGNYYCYDLLVKKCSSDHPRNNKYHDCIIPDDYTRIIFKPANASYIPQLSKRYNIDYWSNLKKWLLLWEAGSVPPFEIDPPIIKTDTSIDRLRI
jgi:SAM-dependent methyltransferase